MRNSIYKILLDMHDDASQVQITAKKGDPARKLVVSFMENGRQYLIEKGCSAVIMVKKPSGAVLLNDCAISLRDNTVEYDFTEQTVAENGLSECEVRLYGTDNDILTSARFTLRVTDTVYEDGQIESESEFTALTAALTAVNNLDLDITDGDEDYVKVLTITKKDGSEKSADIYEWEGTIEQMEGYVEAASESAENAATSESNAEASATAAAGSVEEAAAIEARVEEYTYLSETWANGEIDGVPVSSGHPAYHNNSKYYMQQASEIVGGEDVVKYTEAQTHTDAQKAQARQNIDAAQTVHTHDDRYYTETEMDAKLLAKADLVNGRIPYEELPESAMEFKGTWNAGTNTPTLTPGVGTNGDFYVVEGAGTWEGVSFANGDRIIFDGAATAWRKLTGGEVVSVAGKTGVVTLVKADVGLGNVDNTSDLAKPISTATQFAINGFVGKTTTFNADGTIDETDSSGYTRHVVFSGNVITETYKDNHNVLLATKTTTIGSSTITEVIS